MSKRLKFKCKYGVKAAYFPNTMDQSALEQYFDTYILSRRDVSDINNITLQDIRDITYDAIKNLYNAEVVDCFMCAIGEYLPTECDIKYKGADSTDKTLYQLLGTLTAGRIGDTIIVTCIVDKIEEETDGRS